MHLNQSGDSTVPLWNVYSGALVDTCEVAIKAYASLLLFCDSIDQMIRETTSSFGAELVGSVLIK